MAAFTLGTPETTERVSIRVLLFSVIREKVGRAELEIALASPATGRTLLDRLAEEYPAVARYRYTVRLAVNQTYCDASTGLRDGDEVALITPVSGG